MNAFSPIIPESVCFAERRAGLGQTQRTLVQGGVMMCDVLLAYASFLTASLLYDLPLTHRTMDFAMLVPAFAVVIAMFAGGYESRVLVRPLISAARGAKALIYATGAVLLILFAAKAGTDVSRVAFALGSVLALASISMARLLFAARTRQVARGHVEKVLLIEDGRTAPDTAWTRRADTQAMGIEPDANDPAMLDRIGKLIHRMDRVIVACRPAKRPSWAAVLKSFDAQAEIIDESVDALGVIGAGRAGRSGTLIVAAHPLPVHNRIVKRGFDIVFSGLALLVAVPVFAAVALAILIEDRRPIFFRQQRVGQGNRSFAMLKFRSMRVAQCDEAAAQLTRRGDARVTRVGRFIRATSLDELPQLVNVLLGQMSIVGPRPHAAMAKAGDKLYWQVDRRYWERHALKPGLTGLAQVRGFRGATDHEDHLRDRLQADLEYLSGWSIWRDLRIVAATAKVVVHPQAF